MMTRLRWLTGDRLTPIHAARSYATGIQGVDELATRQLAPAMNEFNSRLAAAEVDFSVFWQRLFFGVASGLSDSAACSLALTDAGCSPLAIDTLAGALTSQLADLRLAYAERYPKMVEQLTLRGRPLREQWDGFGAGLLNRIGKLTHPSFLPKSVTAILLSPYCGGVGGLDATASRLWIEAVLTNPCPEVPEVLRLVWLLSQLGLIEAMTSGTEDSQGDPWVAPTRLNRVAALAMLPLTLDAGSHLELIPPPPSSLPPLFAKAAQTWRLAVDELTLEKLASWWRQFQDLQTPPPVALKALDRMLHPDASPTPGLRR